MTDAPRQSLPQYLAARRSAMRREWKVQVVAGVVAVLCFVGAGFLVTPANSIRAKQQLIINDDKLGTLPWDIALLGKLGTFRALMIDWASIRAERLQQEGKSYEAMQLHEMICSLAPRFPSVWVNAGWNMAYNISVSQYSPEARWQWVRNGIELLRDQGIQYNPQAVAIYKELSWIFWHKIGDFLDDEHLNYKRALAVEMERVLGAPPLDQSEDVYFAWFRKMVEAPRDLDKFLSDDKDIADFVQRLAVVELKPDHSLLDFVARNLRPELNAKRFVDAKQQAATLDDDRVALLTAADNEDVVDRLLAAVRSDVLRNKYHFDLDWMLQMMVEEFGPLDWRNAFSHSLYWASRGDILSREHVNMSFNDQLNNVRFIFSSMQKLVLRGRITLRPDFEDPFNSYIEMTTDTRYIPYLYKVYMAYGKRYFSEHPKFREGTPGPIYMNGFVNSLSTWIGLLYLEGGEANMKQAENYYAWLREFNPHPDGSTQEQYQLTVEHFVMFGAVDQLQTYRMARAFVGSLIHKGLKQLALEQSEPGRQSFFRAKKAYDIWMVDTKRDINERRKMEAFPIVVRDEIEAYLTNPKIAPLFKATIWKNLPLEQRQLTYDTARPFLENLCVSMDPPWDVKLAFPEPPGMSLFRARTIETVGKRAKDGTEQGKRYKP